MHVPDLYQKRKTVSRAARIPIGFPGVYLHRYAPAIHIAAVVSLCVFVSFFVSEALFDACVRACILTCLCHSGYSDRRMF